MEAKETLPAWVDGAETKVKPVLVAVPAGVVTLTLPLVPDATTAVIWVKEFTVKELAAVPPKLTAVAPVKLVPVITTETPVPELVGVKEEMAGGDTTKTQAAPVLELSVFPPASAVVPSELNATQVPCAALPEEPVPTNLFPCWVHVVPLRAKIHDAPVLVLSEDPPMMAVLPSALKATDLP